MFKGLGDLASLVKQAQEIQGRMSDMQDQLGKLRVEGSSGGGMVTVAASGQQKILSIHVESSLLDSEDSEVLEDLLVAATNQALDKAREQAAEEMAKVTGNINLPGIGNALSKMGLGGNPPDPA